MSVELTMLLYSTILFFVLIMIPAGEAILKNGGAVQAGPRDNMPEPSVFNKRATRLRNNMMENMVMFAPLVLIAHAAGVSTDATILGAQLFFYARVVHAVLYLFPVPWVRPLAWAVSVVGLFKIALALL
ncbi:MAPEG family protein [Gimibacter soli]|uniref:MAPEG family protein n=1 Tax=Gimibacter soli TaxID=3024400 RepID=A0AAE9XUP6_9PROT|nr:MAPEG family protein [Gimibacter soli]WCL55431.1 MAPEG family protein [Gimibacter soli]